MAYFEWKAEYSVGIEKIDIQHRQIVTYLNDLYEAMKAGKGKDAMNEVFDGLVQYTKAHFTTEESLMKLYKYPEFEEHKQKHRKMTGRVSVLQQKFDTGELSSPIQITNFLKDWLTKHIMGTDRAYAPFLNDKGVK